MKPAQVCPTYKTLITMNYELFSIVYKKDFPPESDRKKVMALCVSRNWNFHQIELNHEIAQLALRVNPYPFFGTITERVF